MPIVNCTPHPIDVYPADTPDTIDRNVGVPEPVTVLPPAGTVARIVEATHGEQRDASYAPVPVELVSYAGVADLPDKAADTWYVVSLPIALALPARRDLLVPYRLVRNVRGTVIGCRSLARPA